MLLGMMGSALGISASQLSYVAFSGGGPAVVVIIGGQPDVELPTMREGGLDAVLYNWRGLWAPPGIPEEHREQLATLADEIARSEEWKRECKLRGWQDLYMPPAEFASFLKTETTSVEDVLRPLGLVG